MSIPNFGTVTPNFFRSGQPNERGYLDLFSLGVRHVVQLNGANMLPAGMALYPVPIPTFTVDLVQIRAFTNILKELVEENTGIVLVHCTHGRDRTGLIVGAYRLLVQNWTMEQVDAERAEFGVDNIIVEIADFAIHEALAELARKEESA